MASSVGALQPTPKEQERKTPSDLDDQKDNVENSQSTVKKRRGPVKVAKRSDTAMKCPVCEFQSHLANTWKNHLFYKHRTSAYLAGVALLCECGHEGLSEGHSYRCSIANFTVIRKREGPIQTFDDTKTTPKCVICKAYPKTLVGYMAHLRDIHKSTLLSNEVYLLCCCGVKLQSQNYDINRTKICNGRKFSLRNLDGTLFEFKQVGDIKDVDNEQLEDMEKSGIDKNENALKKENHKVNTIYRAMSEISEGENGVHLIYRAMHRGINEIASVQMPLSQWKNLLRMFEKSEERLKEGDEFLSVIYHRNMNVEIRKKERRKAIKGISARIILAKLAEFKKKFVGVVDGNEKVKWNKVMCTEARRTELNLIPIYRAMSEISEGEHGVRSLYRALCRRIDEVASIKLPLSQCKALLRMFEKSEERLKGGDEFLDLIYHSNRNMSVEIRKKEMRKLIRGISTRIILAKLAEFKKKFVNGVEGNENITWKKICSPADEKVKKDNKEVNDIYKAVIQILDGTPLSQWKSVLRKFENPGDELIEGMNILERVYSSTQNKNERVRQRAYIKLTRRLARRFLRAEVELIKPNCDYEMTISDSQAVLSNL